MEEKSLKRIHRDISWSTRIYALLTIFVAAGAIFFNAMETDWALTIISAIAGILLVESFAIFFHRHPKAWNLLRWILILALLTFIIIGSVWGKISNRVH